MVNVEEVTDEVNHLLKAKFPKAKVSRVNVEESSDADGDPSMNIQVVFKLRPSKPDMRYGSTGLIDEMRSWLSRKGDYRFPYFSFISEQEEKELLQ